MDISNSRLALAPSARAFTLIELLIVVAIIAILAAIAVPNFLEAQVRAKVSRAKADMRSLVTAVEAYRVDHNDYNEGTDNPDNIDDAIVAYLTPLGLTAGFYGFRSDAADPALLAGRDFHTLTTPISYISVVPLDPFSESVLTYCFRNAKERKNGYVMTSFGPDTDLKDQSGGGPGKGSTVDNPFSTRNDSGNPARLGDVNERAVVHYLEGTGGYDVYTSADFLQSLRGLSYDPTNGTVSEGDLIRVGPEIFKSGD